MNHRGGVDDDTQPAEWSRENREAGLIPAPYKFRHLGLEGDSETSCQRWHKWCDSPERRRMDLCERSSLECASVNGTLCG